MSMEKMKPYTRATFWFPLLIATAVYGVGDVLLKSFLVFQLLQPSVHLYLPS